MSHQFLKLRLVPLSLTKVAMNIITVAYIRVHIRDDVAGACKCSPTSVFVPSFAVGLLYSLNTSLS